MKVLLDTCVWGGARQALVEAGHQIEWVGDWPRDPGDREILRYAYDNASVLVTLDKDFGELAIVQGIPHVGIIRLVNLRARQQGPACVEVLKKHGDILLTGAIITVTADRIRIRRSE